MTLSRTFILIKGEPKALQIDEISLEENGCYSVKFKNSETTFHYSSKNVVCLENANWYDHLNCKVYIGGHERTNIADIRSFQQDNLTHWRITFNNGFVQDYKHGTIHVIENCLTDDISKSSFEYLKRVSLINDLGKDEERGGILPEIYNKIDFIDKELAIAPYLNHNKNKIKSSKVPALIFPFGCNASQEKAVTAAFANQISVIQGPPGTGKTQTILNIIANILLQGKTVMIVSNNNSATTNVKEKLQKYGLDFIVAALGKNENKEDFINNQPVVPEELANYGISKNEYKNKINQISSIIEELRRIFTVQEKLSLSKQELKEVVLEWNHFKQDNNINDNTYKVKPGVESKTFMSLWLNYLAYAENDIIAPKSFFAKLKERLRWLWLNIVRKYTLGIKSAFDIKDLGSIILELQSSYYISKIAELTRIINGLESTLSFMDSKSLNNRLTATSMDVLKSALCEKYIDKERIIFSETNELKKKSDYVLSQYPVVLSTTFSAKTSLSDSTVYDYLIMDEASQVSVETGALAMTCAKNAVIVGDTLQLPNVVTLEDKLKLDAIFAEFKVNSGYDSSNNSFLQSVCTVLPEVKQTLLREHYRCHPRIINFCNQKFYGGNLLIMTEDFGEENVLSAIKTVPGNHCRGHYNQREIDVVKQELLVNMPDIDEVGIITPYNSQVNAFNRQVPDIEAATVHKYQGREKDTIIMSAVDDQITAFSDDPNLLNVAISRAKKRFCLVLSGNEQELKGNLNDLVDYISYNNFSVTKSNVTSVFDYLYSQYSKQRRSIMANCKKISNYDSENLTYKLLLDIISEKSEFNHLGVLCHMPLRNIIRDWTLMNEEEQRYISHYSTHIDFLIINHVTKKPVLALEIDGYSFHNDKTIQHKRDLLKDHIMELYGLPLLRLSTTGSGEYSKVMTKLTDVLNL